MAKSLEVCALAGVRRPTLPATRGLCRPQPPLVFSAHPETPTADSTISQPRYGRNQPPRNHEPTILRVEYKNDTISTQPSHIRDSPNQTAIQPHSNLNKKNWRKIVRSESFASEVPRIVHAKIAQPRHVRHLARDATPSTLKEKTNVHPRLDYSLLPYSTGNQVR